MSETPTPRTDEAELPVYHSNDEAPKVVYADFARQLERELSRTLKLAEDNGKLAHQTACELAEAREQRDTLAEAAKILADEYEDRRAQWGSEYLWAKHECTDAVNNAISTIRKSHEKAMNQTDTPTHRTDAIYSGMNALQAKAELQKMERELAEARKQRDTLAEALERYLEKSEQLVYGAHGNAYLPNQLKTWLKLTGDCKTLATVKGGTP
jgi:chromosome segregation ATPase